MNLDEITSIDSLDDLEGEEETLSIPVGICFTPTEAVRYHTLKDRLKKISRKKKLSDFSRHYLRLMMDRVETMIEAKEKELGIKR